MKQRTLCEEVECVELEPELFPLAVQHRGLCFKEEALQGFVEGSDCLLFGDALEALEPDEVGFRRCRERRMGLQDRLALKLYRQSGTAPWPNCA